MKVLHITTSDQGGAGIAAKRIHCGLLEKGIDSKLLVLTSPHPKDLKVTPFKSRISNRITNKIFTILSKPFPKTFQHLNFTRNIYGNFEIFTTPTTSYRVEDHPLVKEADIIHLHWVANFINYKSFFKKLGKNKNWVWTLHDMNPFMGGFHYLGDYETNSQLHILEKEFKEIKSEALKNVPDQKMRVIFLNQWMKQISSSAGILNRFPSVIIPNGMDIRSLAGTLKENSRSKLGISESEKVIMFGCQAIRVRRKGFDLLQDALAQLTEKNNQPITLLTIGEKLPEMKIDSNVRVIQLGYLRNRTAIQEAYSASDVFVLPSREDNLPNVMIEAWASGTPVVSFCEGGMKDHIINGKNGILVEQMTSKALSEALESALYSMSFDSNFCVNYAFDNFNNDLICKKIIDDVYHSF